MTVNRAPRWLPPALTVAGLVVALLLTTLFPEVEGLGGRVRLPVFHGALTWVNLGAFALLGIFAIVFLVRGTDAVYRWEQAFRWTGIGAWLIGTLLGLLAAMKTWDFTGSQQNPLEVAAADPRMQAQFWIVILGLAVLALVLIVDNRKVLVAADAVFVVVAWTLLLHAILGPGRALHPDSPILNSEELVIQLSFLGIVVSLAAAYLAAVWWVSRKKA